MSHETEWSEGIRTPEYKEDRDILRPRLIAVLILGALAMALLLPGCASQPVEEEMWHRICYEQPIGRTENGLIVVRHFCVKEEEPIRPGA